ncbi:MAG: Hint domain-containing protein [Xanthobacteraceae bacterium]
MRKRGTVVTGDVQDLGATAQRTRRNIVKMGTILGSAVLGSAVLASAKASASGPTPTPPPRSCFLKGTAIRTADGDRKVEDLTIGDLLPTMFGGTRAIQWLGRYPIRKSDRAKPWVKDALPVWIAPSAIGPGVPHAAFYVTTTHALFIDGVLVPAGLLINGSTIKRYEAREYDELEFFHVKLESHDVIYAEGAPVETLLNVDESAVNFAEYFRMYGAPKTEEIPCVPRSYIGGRGELKSRFRSAISPWFDRRDKFVVIRDRFEEQGTATSRNPELVS